MESENFRGEREAGQATRDSNWEFDFLKFRRSLRAGLECRDVQVDELRFDAFADRLLPDLGREVFEFGRKGAEEHDVRALRISEFLRDPVRVKIDEIFEGLLQDLFRVFRIDGTSGRDRRRDDDLTVDDGKTVRRKEVGVAERFDTLERHQNGRLTLGDERTEDFFAVTDLSDDRPSALGHSVYFVSFDVETGKPCGLRKNFTREQDPLTADTGENDTGSFVHGFSLKIFKGIFCSGNLTR